MNDPKLITVTLNPSLDRTLVVHYLAVGYHNRTRETTRLDPAGKGVNIARALNKMRCPTHAIVLLGNNATAKAYEALIAEETFPTTTINIEGKTRSNIFILDDANNNETCLYEDGFEVTPDDLERVTNIVRQTITPGDFVLLAGSLPHGAPPEIYAQLCEVAHEAGAEVAIVSGGEVLKRALKAKPLLVTLSQTETEAFFNYPVRVKEDVLSCARQLREKGAKQVLIETRTTGHALLVTEDGDWQVDLPQAEKEGTSTGIWSALRAGFLAGWTRKLALPESLTLGAAAAAYTADRIGNEFGDIAEIEEYLEGVQVRSVVNDDEPADDSLGDSVVETAETS